MQNEDNGKEIYIDSAEAVTAIEAKLKEEHGDVFFWTQANWEQADCGGHTTIKEAVAEELECTYGEDVRKVELVVSAYCENDAVARLTVPEVFEYLFTVWSEGGEFGYPPDDDLEMWAKPTPELNEAIDAMLEAYKAGPWRKSAWGESVCRVIVDVEKSGLK